MDARRSRHALHGTIIALLCLGIVWASLVLRPAAAYADIANDTYDNVPWRITDAGKLLIGTAGETTQFTYRKERQEGDFPWIAYNDQIVAIEILGTVKGNGGHATMFAYNSSVETIDLSGFDTSKVESMAFMFHGCEALQALDLSGFDTGNVADMQFMFADCSSLTSLDLHSFDVSKVDSLMCMFMDCTSLESVNLTGWSTKSTADTTEMFYTCSSLRSVDLSLLPPVTTNNDILSGANALTSIKLGAQSRLDNASFSSAYTWSHNMTDAYSETGMRAYGGKDPGTYYAVYKVSFDHGTGTGTASPVYTPIDTAGSYVLPDAPSTLVAPQGMTFDAWDKGAPGTSIALAGDTTLTALWKERTSFTISWKVDGATTSEAYSLGQTPTFSGSTDKAPDDQYSYAFSAWSPSIAPVTGDQTYTAQFERTTHVWGKPSWTWGESLGSATVGLTCSDCGYHLERKASVSSAETLAPTCTKEGTQAYSATATIGGVRYTSGRTKAVAALGHNYTGAWHANAEGHWLLCSRCGVRSIMEPHVSGGAATADHAESCSVCGYQINPALAVVAEVYFENTGETTFDALSFRQANSGERTWSVSLPTEKPRMAGGYFESWACSQRSGEFAPGTTLTFAYADTKRVVFTALWTPLIGKGTFDLKAGRYRLDVDVQSLAGDPTVYASDQYVYVPSARSYTFS